MALFTEFRFGEQSALKWKNVDFKLGVIKVRETRVRGEEGRPKKTWDGNQRTAQPLAAVAASLIEDETLGLHHTFMPFMNIDMELAAVTAPSSLEL